MTRALSLVLLALVALVGCGPMPAQGDAGADAANDAAASPLVARWVSTRVVPSVVPFTTWTLDVDGALVATLDVAIDETCGAQSTSHERLSIRPSDAGSGAFVVESVEACAARRAACAGTVDPCDRARLLFPLGSPVYLYVAPSGLLMHSAGATMATFERAR
jgi:hypothetical protein